MQFLIADTFTKSLSRLANQEQNEAKICAFELQTDITGKGKSFHKIDKSHDKNFWSVRVSRDIRIILHRNDEHTLLCYVDHHDAAYLWAERRKIEVHPETQAAQIVEVRERVEEISIPHYKQAPRNALFAEYNDKQLLQYGVPEEWLADVRAVSDEDTLLILVDHLPSEAGEALVEIATGGRPKARPQATNGNSFEHPDALQRFRAISDLRELQAALDAPWERWIVFLHPEQRSLATRSFNGPVRISGSAGTGKTVLALHRAVELAKKYEDDRILITTISKPLARFLDSKLRLLLTEDHAPRLKERIDVRALDDMGVEIYKRRIGPVKLISPEEQAALIGQLKSSVNRSKTFLYDEWHNLIDAWDVRTWEDYREAPRLGRRTRLTEEQRHQVWATLSSMREHIAEQGQITISELFHQLCRQNNLPYDHVVVDEAQDISGYHLRFLQSMVGKRPDGLFFVGDLGQRIFQQPFSWRYCGVDIRGRSQTLKVNYRTSHQIRRKADLLLDPNLQDYDGNQESREHTISVFNGPEPTLLLCDDPQDEIQEVASHIRSWLENGVTAREIGVFVRSDNELSRALSAIQAAGLEAHQLDRDLMLSETKVSVSTMHLAKGLEFRAVVVMACDEEVIPSQERIEQIADQSDLNEVLNTERYLLYVACTRARDHLLVTGVNPGSEFVMDLLG